MVASVCQNSDWSSSIDSSSAFWSFGRIKAFWRECRQCLQICPDNHLFSLSKFFRRSKVPHARNEGDGRWLLCLLERWWVGWRPPRVLRRPRLQFSSSQKFVKFFLANLPTWSQVVPDLGKKKLSHNPLFQLFQIVMELSLFPPDHGTARSVNPKKQML